MHADPMGSPHSPGGPLNTLLVVSEDAELISHFQGAFKPAGIRVLGCMGPSQPCLLDQKGHCSLAEHSSVVVVDSPPSGVFGQRWNAVPAGTYAERLADLHPGALVVLCGAPLGTAGPTGDVAHVADREAAMSLVHWLMGSEHGGDD